MLIGAELSELQRPEFKAYLQLKKRGHIQSDFEREMGDNACHSFSNNKQHTEEYQRLITSNTQIFKLY